MVVHFASTRLHGCVDLPSHQVNSTYEAEVPEGFIRPEATASRSDREKWIRAKYEQRGFVPDETLPVAALGDVMCKVCKAAHTA